MSNPTHITAAQLSLVKAPSAFVFKGTPNDEGLVRYLCTGSFVSAQRNIRLIGRTGDGKAHLSTAITASLVHAGTRGRHFTTADLATRFNPIRLDSLDSQATWRLPDHSGNAVYPDQQSPREVLGRAYRLPWIW